MPDAALYNWSDRPTDHPMPKIERRRIIGSQAMISHVVLEQGCEVPSHAHQNEQFAIVLSGRARFTLGDPDGNDCRQIEVVGSPEGTVLHLPTNVPHGCLALERCVILDIFAPPSQTTGIDRD